MKAIEYKAYGAADVFQLNEVTKPSPKHNEVLIKIYASTVTAADIMMREGKPCLGRLYLGMKRPKRTILGFDFAGEVVETGKDVVAFSIGDKVFGGTTSLGCYAEYVCVNVEDVISHMPPNISYEEAAPVSGSGVTVLNFLKGKANIKKNDKVLIIGASGALGTYAIQYAKQIGAVVTGVCSSVNLEMVKDLGADKVIDYAKEDFTKQAEKYDIIFDTVGKRSFLQCKNSLTKNDIYISSVINFQLLRSIVFSKVFGTKRAKTSSTGMLPVKERSGYFMELKDLLATKKIKSVMDQHYPLANIAEAHKYVEKGHKKGNLIITI